MDGEFSGREVSISLGNCEFRDYSRKTRSRLFFGTGIARIPKSCWIYKASPTGLHLLALPCWSVLCPVHETMSLTISASVIAVRTDRVFRDLLASAVAARAVICAAVASDVAFSLSAAAAGVKRAAASKRWPMPPR